MRAAGARVLEKFDLPRGTAMWFSLTCSPRWRANSVGDKPENAEKSRIAMERVLGYTKFKLSNKRPAIAAARKPVGAAPIAKTKRKRHVS